jgi:hypothetical protein
VLAPIPVAFLVAASIEVLRRRDDQRASMLILHMWLPFACGVMLVRGSISIAFWRLGALDAFLSTTFLYPLGALSNIEAAPLSRLVISFAIFSAAMAPWLLYTALSVPASPARMSPRSSAGWASGLSPRFWSSYYRRARGGPTTCCCFIPPAGVLAARGLDLAVTRLRRPAGAPTFPTMTLSLLLVVPVVAALGYPAGETARRLYTSISERGDLEPYQRTVSSDYANAADAAAFLDLNAPPGSIYVFGDPTIHLLSGRLQAIPVQGSAWDFYLPSHWQHLPTDLEAAHPVWIFIESRNSVERNSPATTALIARDYRVVLRLTGGGTPGMTGHGGGRAESE